MMKRSNTTKWISLSFLLYTIVVLLLLSLDHIPSVNAMPNGAPTCESGTAAVASAHLDPSRNPVSGNLSSYGYEVYLNGTILESGNITHPTLFNAHTNVTLTVKATGGLNNTYPFFRGILLLLYQPEVNVHDGEGLQLIGSGPSSTELQTAGACVGTLTSGITHVSNIEKREASVIIHYDTTVGVATLDINIVYANNDRDGSAYFFQKYYLQAFGEEDDEEHAPCGLFGFSIFCPYTFCGFFGRLFGLCPEEEHHHDEEDHHKE